MRHILIFLGAALALVGVVGWGAPAPLVAARVTRVKRSTPEYAELALQWGSGARPQRVIIDLQAPDATGSTTISGSQVFFSLPVHGQLNTSCTIVATAFYRTLGHLHTAKYTFQSTIPA